MDKVKKKMLSSMLESFINGNTEQSEVEFHNFLNLKTKEMISEKKECDEKDEDDDSDDEDEDDEKESSKKKKKFEKFKKESDDEDEDEDEKPKKKEKKLKEGLNQPIAGSISSAIKGKINSAPKKPRAKKVKSL
jgi:hypothetical protein